MMNEGDGWAGSGANPWRLDRDTESIMFLTNEGERPVRIGFSVTATGVHYYLTKLVLAAHETQAIDLRKLRDAQEPDFRGHTIPALASAGSLNWIRLDDVPVTGRGVPVAIHPLVPRNRNSLKNCSAGGKWPRGLRELAVRQAHGPERSGRAPALLSGGSLAQAGLLPQIV